MSYQREKTNKENYKKHKILDLQSKITEMKNSLNGPNNRFQQENELGNVKNIQLRLFILRNQK